MLAELESSQLEVCLAPSKRSDARDWDMIRVCLSRNADWYRRFCADHPSSRGVRRGKFDTRIKRRNVIAALNGLIAGTYCGKYAADLLAIARRMKGAA
jgi:hypothetical protein